MTIEKIRQSDKSKRALEGGEEPAAKRSKVEDPQEATVVTVVHKGVTYYLEEHIVNGRHVHYVHTVDAYDTRSILVNRVIRVPILDCTVSYNGDKLVVLCDEGKGAYSVRTFDPVTKKFTMVTLEMDETPLKVVSGYYFNLLITKCPVTDYLGFCRWHVNHTGQVDPMVTDVSLAACDHVLSNPLSPDSLMVMTPLSSIYMGQPAPTDDDESDDSEIESDDSCSDEGSSSDEESDSDE